jgi:hypothetical protein
MCVKIVRLKKETEYDQNSPIEEQIRGSKKIVINYKPEDPSLGHFLQEIEKLCKNGVTANLTIEVNHQNYLNGKKVQKRVSELSMDMDLNNVIKLLATSQHEMDRRLGEMSELCLKRSCDK